MTALILIAAGVVLLTVLARAALQVLFSGLGEP